MHFQWASDDLWSQHVRSGRGLCWNYVTLMNRMVGEGAASVPPFLVTLYPPLFIRKNIWTRNSSPILEFIACRSATSAWHLRMSRKPRHWWRLAVSSSSHSLLTCGVMLRCPTAASAPSSLAPSTKHPFGNMYWNAFVKTLTKDYANL